MARSGPEDLSLLVMRPVELMTEEVLVAEATRLQHVYEAHLRQVSETVGRATMGDMDDQLTRYFDVRSELQQRLDGGPGVRAIAWRPPDLNP